MRKLEVALSVALVVGLFTAAATAVDVQTVRVGDPGNVGDTRAMYGDGTTGYGSVAYTYRIGKYEVTAGQYCGFLNAVARSDPYGLYNLNMAADSWYGCRIERSGTSGNYVYSVGPDWADRPVNYVSFWDSCRFANWLNNGQGNADTEQGTYTLTAGGIATNAITRNPGATWAVASENEWYKAAYYKGGSTDAGYYNYPTSSDTVPGNDMADASRNNANLCTADYGCPPIDSRKYTTVGGEFQDSASPYGTYDQGGNVWEWNEGRIWTSFRSFRGGCFYNHEDALRAQARNGYNFETTYESYSIGFRVSELPEPAAVLMFGLGGVLLLRRSKA